jgi:hypothetical protein
MTSTGDKKARCRHPVRQQVSQTCDVSGSQSLSQDRNLWQNFVAAMSFESLTQGQQAYLVAGKFSIKKNTITSEVLLPGTRFWMEPF